MTTQAYMTIQEVAKVAGVSYSAVSRVLNNRPGVSGEVVRKVNEAVKNSDSTVRPPACRPGPRLKVKNSVKNGLVVVLNLGLRDQVNKESGYLNLILGIDEGLAERGLSMIVSHVGHGEPTPVCLSNGQIDGTIVVGYEPGKQLTKIIKRHPYVGVYSDLSSSWGDCIHIDHNAIGQMASRYLIEHGHNHIAFLSVYAEHAAFRTRGEAFVRAARDSGVPVEIVESEANEIQQDDTLDFDVSPLVDKLLALSPRPTGVFIPSDFATAAVYHALISRGVNPGRDITVISCNNETEVLKGLPSRPATFDCKDRFIGRRAVEQLFWRMKHPDDPEQLILVAPSLVQGNGN